MSTLKSYRVNLNNSPFELPLMDNESTGFKIKVTI
jgi:hypothetical protein